MRRRRHCNPRGALKAIRRRRKTTKSKAAYHKIRRLGYSGTSVADAVARSMYFSYLPVPIRKIESIRRHEKHHGARLAKSRKTYRRVYKAGHGRMKYSPYWGDVEIAKKLRGKHLGR